MYNKMETSGLAAYMIAGSFISMTILSGLVLSSSFASADDVVDQINITVPVSCTISGTGTNTHNAEIQNGTYQANIGTTTLHAYCNDKDGFSIYASGFTGDAIGETNSNKLIGTTASGNATIETGLATTASNPDVSNWAMKLSLIQDSGDTTGTNAVTIDSAPNTSGGESASFSQYHTVPNTFVRVAHKAAMTDMTASTGGAKLTTTYAAYISKSQVADTYTGQVKYVLVHPYDSTASSIEIANPLAKTVIENNIIKNDDLYTLKSQTVAALRNSSNMPAKYKDYIKMDEVFGNPKCTRAELVAQLREVTTISREVENIILTNDSVRIAGEDVDLRVFDKPVDGVYVNDIKIGPVRLSWDYEYANMVSQNMTLMTHEIMQNDYNFFDFDAFNEASVNDRINSAGVNRYTMVRNMSNPLTNIEFYYYESDTDADGMFGFNYDVTSFDLSDEIFTMDLNEVLFMTININANTGVVTLNWSDVNSESFSMNILHMSYEDINNIMDDYVLGLRSLATFSTSNVTIVYNVQRYEGVDEMVDMSTLTTEEATNFIRHYCDPWSTCPTYDEGIYDRAKAKTILLPDGAFEPDW